MCDRFKEEDRIKEYRNRKRLKTTIGYELLPITMHPDRVFDWYYSEDEKNNLEKLWNK